MASWEALTAIGTILGTAIGFGVAHGKLRQRVSDMNRQILVNTAKITEIEKEAGTSEGDRREIMAKLDNLTDGQKEMRELLIRHIERREA